MKNYINKLKKENAVTLLVLVVTIVIMGILISTISINVSQLSDEKKKNALEADIRILKEEVEQYYAEFGRLPVKRSYNQTLPFRNDDNVLNINDGTTYYVIDTEKLKVDLNLEGDYIINEQSHTIYYPAGVIIYDEIWYREKENYSSVKGKLQ